MKVIFLDIDGVLNSRQYEAQCPCFEDPRYQMDPTAVARLNRATEQTGAVLVISSTWRLAFPNSLERLQECMREYGIAAEVIGMTPSKPEVVRDRRGAEIQSWLDAGDHDVEAFVIIDDESEIEELARYQVKTLFEEGLQDLHIAQVVALLEAKR